MYFEQTNYSKGDHVRKSSFKQGCHINQPCQILSFITFHPSKVLILKHHTLVVSLVVLISFKSFNFSEFIRSTWFYEILVYLTMQ